MGCSLSFSKPEFWLCHSFKGTNIHKRSATYGTTALTRNLINDSKNQKILQRGHTRWKHKWKELIWLLTTQNCCHPCSALQCSVVTILVLPWTKVLLSLRPGMVFEIISNLLSSQKVFCESFWSRPGYFVFSLVILIFFSSADQPQVHQLSRSQEHTSHSEHGHSNLWRQQDFRAFVTGILSLCRFLTLSCCSN